MCPAYNPHIHSHVDIDAHPPTLPYPRTRSPYSQGYTHPPVPIFSMSERSVEDLFVTLSTDDGSAIGADESGRNALGPNGKSRGFVVPSSMDVLEADASGSGSGSGSGMMMVDSDASESRSSQAISYSADSSSDSDQQAFSSSSRRVARAGDAHTHARGIGQGYGHGKNSTLEKGSYAGNSGSVTTSTPSLTSDDSPGEGEDVGEGARSSDNTTLGNAKGKGLATAHTTQARVVTHTHTLPSVNSSSPTSTTAPTPTTHSPASYARAHTGVHAELNQAQALPGGRRKPSFKTMVFNLLHDPQSKSGNQSQNRSPPLSPPISGRESTTSTSSPTSHSHSYRSGRTYHSQPVNFHSPGVLRGTPIDPSTKYEYPFPSQRSPGAGLAATREEGIMDVDEDEGVFTKQRRSSKAGSPVTPPRSVTSSIHNSDYDTRHSPNSESKRFGFGVPSPVPVQRTNTSPSPSPRSGAVPLGSVGSGSLGTMSPSLNVDTFKNRRTPSPSPAMHPKLYKFNIGDVPVPPGLRVARSYQPGTSASVRGTKRGTSVAQGGPGGEREGFGAEKKRGVEM